MRASLGRRLFGLSKGIYEGCTDLQRVLAFRAVGLRRNSGHGLKLGFRYGTLGPHLLGGGSGAPQGRAFWGEGPLQFGGVSEGGVPVLFEQQLISCW